MPYAIEQSRHVDLGDKRITARGLYIDPIDLRNRSMDRPVTARRFETQADAFAYMIGIAGHAGITYRVVDVEQWARELGR